MTRGETDKIKPGAGVVVAWGRWGEQFAHVIRQAQSPLGGLLVCKWSKNKRRWSQPRRVAPSEVIREADARSRSHFAVEGAPK